MRVVYNRGRTRWVVAVPLDLDWVGAPWGGSRYRLRVGLRDRMSRLDSTLGWAPRPGEPRRDFLARMAERRGYVPKAVHLELVELHDRVAQLETEVAALQAR